MTTHLSARITWHDGGWDGCVCRRPLDNSSCLIHKHVREARDDELEAELAGVKLADLEGWFPPCSRDANAFSPHSFQIVHHDPLEWRSLPPVGEEVPPYSICPAPYRWMREEHLRDIVEAHQIELPPPSDHERERGWVNEPERQRILLHRFWEELERDRSLVFFYCNRGNPFEDGPSRLLIGASRLCDLGPQLMFGKTAEYGADHPVWSRRVTYDFPAQGVRLPLQEYMAAGHDAERLICAAPGDGALAFSYVSEHVPDDLAVGALEQLMRGTEAVRADGLLAEDWDARLAWLDQALEETWSGRGPLPGVGSVLRSLGMERGIAFQRAELSDPGISREELWERVEALLDGRLQPDDEPAFYDSLKRARQRWRALPGERRSLMGVLARFELSVDQVERLAEPTRRRRSGVVADEAEIAANPFLLFEQDWGAAESPRVALDTVDRGVVLEPGRWTDEARMPPDDPARVRAAMVAVLEDAAADGDSFLPLEELLERVEGRFPDRRRCRPDRDLVLGSHDFFGEQLHFSEPEGVVLVALPELREAEELIAGVAARRCGKPAETPAEEPDWERWLDEALAGAGSLSAEAEERAREEKLAALGVLYHGRLSVLGGRAGTGKTSVIRALLNGIEEAEGSQGALLLAPTGKARVRLATTTGSNAETIHQFLLRNEWLDRETLRIRREGGDVCGAPTVIVDEASMISVDLLGALLRALDLNEVKRLIFVGDTNQLPPIGPGRPFVDLVAWIEADEARASSIFELCERARHAEADSRALQLADGYLGGTPPAGSDELLASVARGESDGELAVRFYADPIELREQLIAAVIDAGDLGKREGPEHAAFTESLGGRGPTGELAESWQVLSPVRVGPGGTEDLNRLIQQRFKRGLLERARGRRGDSFGDEELVWTDKVMQLANRGHRAWPPRIGLDYVANGEIGVVVDTDGRKGRLDVAFSTQRDVTYRYFGDAVDEELGLAYAITVHKAQGSDFDTVVLIVPAQAGPLSRELLYTALTRFRKRVILLIEGDVGTLMEFRRPERSEVFRRNSNLFEPQLRPPEAQPGADSPFPHRLIHRARNGTLVRSKAELVVLETLLREGMSVRYEQRLDSPDDPDDFRLPDFTVMFEGVTYYWEHLGMLDVTSYADSWRRKRRWYEENGFADKLITSADGPGAGLIVPEIEDRLKRRILEGEPPDPAEPGLD